MKSTARKNAVAIQQMQTIEYTATLGSTWLGKKSKASLCNATINKPHTNQDCHYLVIYFPEGTDPPGDFSRQILWHENTGNKQNYFIETALLNAILQIITLLITGKILIFSDKTNP